MTENLKTPVTIRRNLSGCHSVMLHGVRIGEAWKYKGRTGFGVRIIGVYWSSVRGGANRTSGSPSTRVKRLKDVPSFVAETLTNLTQKEKSPCR
jgi:hypothetical protein